MWGRITMNPEVYFEMVVITILVVITFFVLILAFLQTIYVEEKTAT